MDQCQEDSQHGMPSMPGGGDPVGGGIWEKDDGGGPHIPGTSERKGPVRGLREIYGGGIIGITQGDVAWAGGRRAVELGRFGHGRRAADVPYGLPDQGKAVELPGGGMPRPGKDEDGDADALFQPACPGYRDHFGGGKPPPPMFPPMRHDGPTVGTKRQVPRHRTVRKEHETKEASDGGGGVEGDHGEGLQGIWEAAGECVGF